MKDVKKYLALCLMLALLLCTATVTDSYAFG